MIETGIFKKLRRLLLLFVDDGWWLFPIIANSQSRCCIYYYYCAFSFSDRFSLRTSHLWTLFCSLFEAVRDWTFFTVHLFVCLLVCSFQFFFRSLIFHKICSHTLAHNVAFSLLIFNSPFHTHTLTYFYYFCTDFNISVLEVFECLIDLLFFSSLQQNSFICVPSV